MSVHRQSVAVAAVAMPLTLNHWLTWIFLTACGQQQKKNKKEDAVAGGHNRQGTKTMCKIIIMMMMMAMIISNGRKRNETLPDFSIHVPFLFWSLADRTFSSYRSDASGHFYMVHSHRSYPFSDIRDIRHIVFSFSSLTSHSRYWNRRPDSVTRRPVSDSGPSHCYW